MYPANFFSLFPAFPRTKTVFVAMSFDKRFDARWKEVIRPAIENIIVDRAKLHAVRVDARVVGDSILTEILSGIGTAQVVFADITSVGVLGERPIRNGNVMYEVGLAHATRLAEEVLLFRSDNDPLLFDTANIRVNDYSPDDKPVRAKQQITETILSALKEVDLRRHLAVQAVANSLDAPSVEILTQCQHTGHFEHPPLKTMGEVLAAISKAAAVQRLLTLGLLEVSYKIPTHEEIEALGSTSVGSLMPYVMTTFGNAVFFEVAKRMSQNAEPTDPTVQH